eukprot:Skav226397  [mRNA]  locus=scaffold3989:32168:41722:- [translate_table: standard]
MDLMKNAALLRYAPKGSCVVRISHTISRPFRGNVLWVRVQAWHSARPSLVSKIRSDVLAQTVNGLKRVLSPEVKAHLKLQSGKSKDWQLSHAVTEFLHTVKAKQGGRTTDEILLMLKAHGFEKEDQKRILDKVLTRRRGDAKDRRKNEALLQIAPPQSDARRNMAAAGLWGPWVGEGWGQAMGKAG